MAKRPRKKKVAPIRKIWELPEEEILAVITHLRSKYPDSAQLYRYMREIKRREEGAPIPEVLE
ncbi:MAG: hypothetical protein ACRC6V_12160 [Bacteroidales bacterium]